MNSHVLDYVEQIDMHLVRKSHLLSLRHSTENVDSLVDSIRQNGLLQPILIRRTDDAFEIVAGHRRFEACRRLRWKRIPACIAELSDKDAFEVALTENLQRKSLNPIEEAEAFQKYVSDYGWGGVSELACRIGKSQEFVSQRIFLLKLPEAVRRKIITRQLNPSAARELIWLKDTEEQTRIANFAVENNMPSRAVRYMVKSIRGQKGKPKIFDSETIYEPAFEKYNALKQHADPSTALMEKTILALRVCMLKIDAILEGVEEEPQYIRDFLMRQRRAVHELVDDAVKMKVNLKQKPIVS